jgi:hypothetical protein
MMRKRALIIAVLVLVSGCSRNDENGTLKLTGTVETTTVAVSFKVCL